ncbi:extensin family protein [Bradyrhizobium erythrophlei]|uniref:extensin family protein n=1 Tax=Bradyrhizobium erythrophlei TaxID=1437360 RepID=UPI0035EF472D
MNFSAEKASRKWANGAFGRGGAAMVTAAAALVWLGMQGAPAEAARRPVRFPWDDLFGSAPRKPRATAHRHLAVPLPKPRPAEAPAAEPEQPATWEKQPPAETAKPDEKVSPPVPQLSACRQALTEAIAIAPSIPDIHGAGGCGGEDLVRLEAIVLPDKRQVAVKPAAILRCKMAAAIADWIRSDIAPLAQGLGSTISDLDNFDSFECRGRNRVVGAQLSEHGRANALDVRAFKLANGKAISLTDRSVPRTLREAVLHSVCARFSTVLGPGSDWYHEDHIHLDLAERRSNYRICQWNVYDPLPQVAPLMPAERPEEAPPREVAAKSDAARPDDGKADAAKSDDEAASYAPPEPKPQPTKKRRQSRRL